jgi:hypothetical protein
MAKNTNNEELRQQALTAIAQGRAEISAEVYHLKRQLSPAQVLHRVVDRHATLVVVLAFTAGIVPALILFRGKRPSDRARPVKITVSKTPPKPLLGAVLMGALGMLGKSLAPSLIKSAVLPRVLESLSRKPPVVVTRKAKSAYDVK